MKILLLDIETAPNKVFAWGLFKQDIRLDQIEEPGYTLCWAAKWAGEKEVMFSSLHRDGELKMVSEIYKLIEEADVVIHYNGTKFDIPVLNQEFLKNGLKPPAPVMEIDLLRTVRNRFRLPSNKLDYVARYLKLQGKVKHKGMALWRECMEGDDKAWETMELYNKHDVLLLERVYEQLLPWIHNHPNHGLFTDEEEMVCPNCGSSHLQKRGFHYTKTLAYQRYRCMDCGSWHKARTNALTKEKRSVIITGIK